MPSDIFAVDFGVCDVDGRRRDGVEEKEVRGCWKAVRLALLGTNTGYKQRT